MPPATPEGLSADDWMARVAAVRRQGNHLAAFDLSLQALAEWPDAAGFEHQAILAPARWAARWRATTGCSLPADWTRSPTRNAPRISPGSAAACSRIWPRAAR